MADQQKSCTPTEEKPKYSDQQKGSASVDEEQRCTKCNDPCFRVNPSPKKTDAVLCPQCYMNETIVRLWESATIDHKYSAKDLVFVKRNGHPHWPGRIEPFEPHPRGKAPEIYPVFLYGIREIGNYEATALLDYYENRETLSIPKKRYLFNLAVWEIENNPDSDPQIKMPSRVARLKTPSAVKKAAAGGVGTVVGAAADIKSRNLLGGEEEGPSGCEGVPVVLSLRRSPRHTAAKKNRITNTPNKMDMQKSGTPTDNPKSSGSASGSEPAKLRCLKCKEAFSKTNEMFQCPWKPGKVQCQKCQRKEMDEEIAASAAFPREEGSKSPDTSSSAKPEQKPKKLRKQRSKNVSSTEQTPESASTPASQPSLSRASSQKSQGSEDCSYPSNISADD